MTFLKREGKIFRKEFRNNLFLLCRIIFIAILAIYFFFIMPFNIRRGKPDVWLSDSIEFSGNGELLTASSRQRAYLWRTGDGKLLKTVPNQANNDTSSSLSSDGKFMASRGSTFTILGTKENRTVYEKQVSQMTGYNHLIYFSPDGRFTLSYDGDLFDIEMKLMIINPLGRLEEKPVSGKSWYSYRVLKKPIDGNWVLLIRGSETDNEKFISVNLCDLKRKILVKNCEIPWTDNIDRRIFVGGSKVFILYEKYLSILYMENLEMKKIPLTTRPKKMYFGDEMLPFCVSADGEHFAIVIDENSENRQYPYYKNYMVNIYGTESGEIISQIHLTKKPPVHFLAIHPEKNLIAVGLQWTGANGEIFLFDMKDKKEVRKLKTKGGSKFLLNRQNLNKIIPIDRENKYPDYD